PVQTQQQSTDTFIQPALKYTIIFLYTKCTDLNFLFSFRLPGRLKTNGRTWKKQEFFY
ncbi:hypothetical protein EWB00_001556, partial [Schistosoma japonicum]